MASAAVVTASNKVPSWFAPPESSLVAVEPGDFGFLAGLPQGPVLRNLLHSREAWSVALEFLFEELALTPKTAEEQQNQKQRGLVPPQSTDSPELVVDRAARRSCFESAAISSDVAQSRLQQVSRHEKEVLAMHWRAAEEQRGAAELRCQAEKDRREAAELRREAEEDHHAARMVRGQAEELRRQAERNAFTAQASNNLGGSAACCDTKQDQGPLFSNAKELLKRTASGKAEPHMPFPAVMQEQAQATAVNPVHLGDAFVKEGNALSSAKSLLATKAGGAAMDELETSPMFQKAKNLVSGAAMQPVPTVKVNATWDLQTNLSEDPPLFGPEARAPFRPPRLGTASIGRHTGASRNAQHVALAVSEAETSSFFPESNLCLGPEARTPFKPPRSLERSMPVNMGVTVDTIDFQGVGGSDDCLLGPTARKQFKRPRVSATAVGSDVGC